MSATSPDVKGQSADISMDAVFRSTPPPSAASTMPPRTGPHWTMSKVVRNIGMEEHSTGASTNHVLNARELCQLFLAGFDIEELSQEMSVSVTGTGPSTSFQEAVSTALTSSGIDFSNKDMLESVISLVMVNLKPRVYNLIKLEVMKMAEHASSKICGHFNLMPTGNSNS